MKQISSPICLPNIHLKHKFCYYVIFDKFVTSVTKNLSPGFSMARAMWIPGAIL